MPCPSQLIAALCRDIDQLAIPRFPLLRARAARQDTPVAIGEAKVAVDHRQMLGWACGHKPTVATWLTASTQGSALCAIHQPRAKILLAAVRVLRILGTPIWSEGPYDTILNETMPMHRPAVVDDNGIGLAVERPQDTADHLAIEPHLARWPCQHAASDRWLIPALGEYHAIGHDIDVAVCQPPQNAVAFVLRRPAVDVLAAHARLAELIADVDGVLDARGEYDRLALLGQPVPVGNISPTSFGLSIRSANSFSVQSPA
jgi:hypothetical protein